MQPLKQNKSSFSVWHVTRAHGTREQPMDTGPRGSTNDLFRLNFKESYRRAFSLIGQDSENFSEIKPNVVGVN